VFPVNQQSQLRMQLSQNLIWVISQRLLPKKDKNWKIAARELMISNHAVKNMIISWKTHQLYWILEVWQKSWMILMDKYLLALYKKWFISKETLISYSRDKESIEMLLK
jgi:twitching motility protein PilT